MPRRSVTVTATVHAPAAKIFDLLTAPSKHPLVDGSGSVRAPLPGAPGRLEHGSAFGMDMKIGLPYRIENTVVEFEEDRLIAWRHLNGHRRRRRLTPLREDVTEVTETFDRSTARPPLLFDLSPVPRRKRASTKRSLDRLGDLFGATA
ncbi:SRPBCC family protein [Lentzea sp. CC55]|uniref:SRPBCC family protein n=1 Tax=Lentzea sp. CC55 TaxID=2884909 RepID=UPI0027E03664|nr:SRPBCC family protein [Lentzea sp. CC55]MCG8927797.1 SRPBCC family protein [Lentzea sp. CC55]